MEGRNGDVGIFEDYEYSDSRYGVWFPLPPSPEDLKVEDQQALLNGNIIKVE